jgi:hypothetical protein
LVSPVVVLRVVMKSQLMMVILGGAERRSWAMGKKPLLESQYMWAAAASWRRLERQETERADSLAREREGRRIEMRRAMMAMTTRSSMRVKA